MGFGLVIGLNGYLQSIITTINYNTALIAVTHTNYSQLAIAATVIA
jgi:hypothetical protein